MSTRSELLKFLNDNSGKYCSGQSIAEYLGVSRNSVWKAMEQLRRDGYTIESRQGIGYRLSGNADILTKDGISVLLSHQCDLRVYDKVTSTNAVTGEFAASPEFAKGNKPLAVVANCQTAGRGRLGRSFFSPAESGIYMSVAYKPWFDLDRAMTVTMATAVAVNRAIEKVCGVSPRIKWVNDLFLNNRKVCGILTEARTDFENGKIESLIIGIGVNCFETLLPADIKNIAGPLATEYGSFSRNALAAAIIDELLGILDNMNIRDFLLEYKRKCFILGKHIVVHPNLDNKALRARAIDIDENGGLVVEYMEGPQARQMVTLTTGEVTVRYDE